MTTYEYEYRYHVRICLNNKDSWPIWIQQFDLPISNAYELEQRFLTYRMEVVNLLENNNGI